MEENVVEEKIKNNKGKGLVIIVIILLIVSLTLGGYIVYDKLINNKKEEEKKETNNSEVKENDEVIEEETNIEVIGDTNKTMVSKEISLLMEKYKLNGIIWKYENVSAIDYTKLSKQSMANMSKKAMVKVMVNSALGESFVSDDIHGTGIDIKLTKEEDEFRDSVVSTAYMYISDFNKYAKDVFKSDIVINNNDTSFDFSSCPSMHVFKDKMYISYQCGFAAGPINDVYTSFVKDSNTIYLYGIKIIETENQGEFKLTRVKYTFEYNGKIWDLKEVEPLEILQ